MPYILMTKKWTPLELFGIQLFRSEDAGWYIKSRRNRLKRLNWGRTATLD